MNGSARRSKQEESPLQKRGSRRKMLDTSSGHNRIIAAAKNKSSETSSRSPTNHQRRTREPTTEEDSSGRSNSDSGWHNIIQKKDWGALQRFLEQVAEPKGGQSVPNGDHKKQKEKQQRDSSAMDTSSNTVTTSNRQKKGPGKKVASWLWKRSVGSTSSGLMGGSSANNFMDRSMNSRSGRRSSNFMDSSVHSTSGRSQSAILEDDEEDDDHIHVTMALSLDKESLLSTNLAGRTPLQLALNTPGIPDHMLKAFIQAQPRAVAIADAKGRLPLHFAVVRQRPLSIIAQLVDLHPQALHHQDQKGKTPVIYAMEVAKRHTNLDSAPKGFWASGPVMMPPTQNNSSTPNAISVQEWQAEQYRRWGTTRWLLEQSTHRHRQYNQQTEQNGIVIATGTAVATSQVDHDHPFLIRHVSTQKISQPMLIEAMLHAAPPAIVAMLITASSFLLAPTTKETSTTVEHVHHQQQRMSLGCSAMYLAIFRQYPITIVRQLGELLADSDEVKAVRDETGLGLVSAHYVTSCFQKSKLLDFVAEEAFMLTMEQCIVEGQLPEDNIAFLQWWEKLKFLICFCSGKDPDQTPDDCLLHAALENTDTPPNVVRLLLGLYPVSARQPDAQSAHPLHRFAMHRDYIPRNYESPYMHGLNVMDMLLSLDESAAFHNFHNRLPLHHAIIAGRNWPTIQPLVSSYRSSLRIPDPATKLYPCQLAATYREENSEKELLRLLQLTRNQYSSIVWQGLSARQQQNAVDRIRQFESLKRLDTIFELFRRFPQCVESAVDKTTSNNRSGKSKSTTDLVVAVKENTGRSTGKSGSKATQPEMITFHYLSWCYKKTGGLWEVEENNMEILQTSIHIAREHRVLSKKSTAFVKWWEMLKMYFSHCYNSLDSADKPFIPQDDAFILHMAVSISCTPPDLIELILGLFPRSASTQLPESKTFPLHLVCKTTVYTPQYFELATTRPSAIELVLRAFPEAAFARTSDGRLPLHFAIQAGKTIGELRPLIAQGPSLVAAPDPVSGLFPFQLMALYRPLASDLRLRFRTLAANRHSSQWNQFSGQRKVKEIRTIEKEYYEEALTSIFELLRLSPSTIDQGIVTGRPSARLSTRAGSGGSSLIDSDSDEDLTVDSDDDFTVSVNDKESRGDAGTKEPRARMGSNMSHNGRSAFSSIDMMSTISNVSSHLSLNRRRRSGTGASRSISGSLVGGPVDEDDVESGDDEESDDDDESEDSDIWSVEDVTFYDDGTKKDKSSVPTGNHSSNNTSQDRQASALRSAKRTTGWEPPVNFAADNETSESVRRRSVPKLIMEPSEFSDDVSLLDDMNTRSRSGRINSALRRSLLEEAAKDAEKLFGNSRKNDFPADVLPEHSESNGVVWERVSPKVAKVIKESPQAQKEHPAKEANASKEAQKVRNEHPINPSPISRVADDDDSIQDDIVSFAGEPPEEPEESVVVFRLRRSTRLRPSGQSRTEGDRPSNSSRNMDFLSILNASLPEGRMDYLSTLEVSASSLPPGSDSMPTGLDAQYFKCDRMAQIRELPGESEHGTLLTRQGSRRKSAAGLEESTPVDAQGSATERRRSIFDIGEENAINSAAASHPMKVGKLESTEIMDVVHKNSPRNTPGLRHSSLEIIPRTSNNIGVKPYKLKSCLRCGMHAREVMMIPCSHPCLCHACAEVFDMKSCPLCFGPVTEQRVVSNPGI
jgi:hypothetical protein